MNYILGLYVFFRLMGLPIILLSLILSKDMDFNENGSFQTWIDSYECLVPLGLVLLCFWALSVVLSAVSYFCFFFFKMKFFIILPKKKKNYIDSSPTTTL